jgi:hypothetical protein
LERMPRSREMYRTVLGDGIGELANLCIVLLGGVPDGGVFCVFGDPRGPLGERAKLGIRNASMGLLRRGRGEIPSTPFGCACAFPLLISFESSSEPKLFHTSCMPPPPPPPLRESEDAHIDRSGRPCFSISYHIHCPTKAQSTVT